LYNITNAKILADFFLTLKGQIKMILYENNGSTITEQQDGYLLTNPRLPNGGIVAKPSNDVYREHKVGILLSLIAYDVMAINSGSYNTAVLMVQNIENYYNFIKKDNVKLLDKIAHAKESLKESIDSQADELEDTGISIAKQILDVVDDLKVKSAEQEDSLVVYYKEYSSHGFSKGPRKDKQMPIKFNNLSLVENITPELKYKHYLLYPLLGYYIYRFHLGITEEYYVTELIDLCNQFNPLDSEGNNITGIKLSAKFLKPKTIAHTLFQSIELLDAPVEHKLAENSKSSASLRTPLYTEGSTFAYLTDPSLRDNRIITINNVSAYTIPYKPYNLLGIVGAIVLDNGFKPINVLDTVPKIFKKTISIKDPDSAAFRKSYAMSCGSQAFEEYYNDARNTVYAEKSSKYVAVMYIADKLLEEKSGEHKLTEDIASDHKSIIYSIATLAAFAASCDYAGIHTLGIMSKEAYSAYRKIAKDLGWI
jgi:hypothetical protein